MKPRALLCALLTVLSGVPSAPAGEGTNAAPAAKIIFDTDIGNDVDDVLALGLLHTLQSRGACELLAVTVTKRDELAGPFVDAINTFYGRPDLPVGCIRGAVENRGSNFLRIVEEKDGGQWRYPHRLLRSSDAPDATPLLRRVLAAQADGSVVLAQVGFFSNFAALLDSGPDEVSPLPGKELIRRKVKLLSVMAGCFQTVDDNNHYREFNVVQDIPAAQKLAREWPTSIIWSGAEIGLAIRYPAASIERDYNYVPHHPLADAYRAYRPPPHERPTWDLTAALYAVFPEAGYFDLSREGRVTIDDDGFTRFTPGANGRDRFLKVGAAQALRARELFAQLCSQPPTTVAK